MRSEFIDVGIHVMRSETGFDWAGRREHDKKNLSDNLGQVELIHDLYWLSASA